MAGELRVDLWDKWDHSCKKLWSSLPLQKT